MSDWLFWTILLWIPAGMLVVRGYEKLHFHMTKPHYFEYTGPWWMEKDPTPKSYAKRQMDDPSGKHPDLIHGSGTAVMVLLWPLVMLLFSVGVGALFMMLAYELLELLIATLMEIGR